jgi:uroporphyrinogen-III synthase
MAASILVLRKDDEFSAALRNSGLLVENLVLIRTEAVSGRDAVDELRQKLDLYEGLIFTSPASVEVVLEQMRDEVTHYEGQIYVLGSRAAKLFELAGVNVRYVPAANTAADMLDGFGDAEFDGKRLCFIRGDHTVGTISERLARIAELDEAVVYRTIETPPDEAAVGRWKERLEGGEFDWACFFSPSSVEAFCRTFSVERGFKAAAIGATTAQRAGQAGLDVAFVSPQASTDSFAESFIGHLKSIE